MDKNYWRHQIGIWEIVQLNYNKHGFIEQPFTFVLQNRLISATLIKKTPVLSCQFCKISKNPFWQNTSGQLPLDFFHSLNCILPPSELIEIRFFLFLNMFYHSFRTWWILRTLLHETDNLVVAAGKDISMRNQELGGVFQAD